MEDLEDISAISSSSSLVPFERSYNRPEDRPELNDISNHHVDPATIDPTKVTGKQRKRPKIRPCASSSSDATPRNLQRSYRTPGDRPDLNYDTDEGSNLHMRERNQELLKNIVKQKPKGPPLHLPSSPRPKRKKTEPRNKGLSDTTYDSEAERERIRDRVQESGFQQFAVPKAKVAAKITLPARTTKVKRTKEVEKQSDEEADQQEEEENTNKEPQRKKSRKASSSVEPLTPAPRNVDDIFLESDDEDSGVTPRPRHGWRQFSSQRTYQGRGNPKNKNVTTFKDHTEAVVSSPDTDPSPATSTSQSSQRQVMRRSRLSQTLAHSSVPARNDVSSQNIYSIHVANTVNSDGSQHPESDQRSQSQQQQEAGGQEKETLQDNQHEEEEELSNSAPNQDEVNAVQNPMDMDVNDDNNSDSDSEGSEDEELSPIPRPAVDEQKGENVNGSLQRSPSKRRKSRIPARGTSSGKAGEESIQAAASLENLRSQNKQKQPNKNKTPVLPDPCSSGKDSDSDAPANSAKKSPAEKLKLPRINQTPVSLAPVAASESSSESSEEEEELSNAGTRGDKTGEDSILAATSLENHPRSQKKQHEPNENKTPVPPELGSSSKDSDSDAPANSAKKSPAAKLKLSRLNQTIQTPLSLAPITANSESSSESSEEEELSNVGTRRDRTREDSILAATSLENPPRSQKKQEQPNKNKSPVLPGSSKDSDSDAPPNSAKKKNAAAKLQLPRINQTPLSISPVAANIESSSESSEEEELSNVGTRGDKTKEVEKQNDEADQQEQEEEENRNKEPQRKKSRKTSSSVEVEPLTTTLRNVDDIFLESDDEDSGTPRPRHGFRQFSSQRTYQGRGKPKNKNVTTLKDHIEAVISSPDTDPSPATSTSQSSQRQVMRRSRLNQTLAPSVLARNDVSSQSIYSIHVANTVNNHRIQNPETESNRNSLSQQQQADGQEMENVQDNDNEHEEGEELSNVGTRSGKSGEDSILAATSLKNPPGSQKKQKQPDKNKTPVLLSSSSKDTDSDASANSAKKRPAANLKLPCINQTPLSLAPVAANNESSSKSSEEEEELSNVGSRRDKAGEDSILAANSLENPPRSQKKQDQPNKNKTPVPPELGSSSKDSDSDAPANSAKKSLAAKLKLSRINQTPLSLVPIAANSESSSESSEEEEELSNVGTRRDKTGEDSILAATSLENPSRSQKKQKQQNKNKTPVLPSSSSKDPDSDAAAKKRPAAKLKLPRINKTPLAPVDADSEEEDLDSSGNDVASENDNHKSRTQNLKAKSKGKKPSRREHPWGPDHPFMVDGGGHVLYNKHLLDDDDFKVALARYASDVSLSSKRKESLFANIDKYIENMFDKLCDNSPLYYGVWTFSQLMSQLKQDGLLHEDANQKAFISLLKDTVGPEQAKKAEGYLYPRPGKRDTLDMYDC